MKTHASTTLLTSSSLSDLSGSRKNVFATESSASSGHSLNQSIVQQFTSDGNMRRRCRNSSDTGDMARTQCRLDRTRVMKYAFTAFFVRGKPCCDMIGRRAFSIVPKSSDFHRFGTSPLLRMLLMSSRKFSCTICVSVKRKTTSLPSAPAMKFKLLERGGEPRERLPSGPADAEKKRVAERQSNHAAHPRDVLDGVQEHHELHRRVRHGVVIVQGFLDDASQLVHVAHALVLPRFRARDEVIAEDEAFAVDADDVVPADAVELLLRHLVHEVAEPLAVFVVHHAVLEHSEVFVHPEP
eukprot:31278-Pelagococcus_subviridis.AAC.11